jgi:sulfoacetaldehyde acetyltransferase
VPATSNAGDGAFGITMVVFRNYQWGAEKRNTTLWYDDNFVGTELDPNLSFAKVAEGCGLKGITVKTQAELTAALKQSCEDQKKRKTTFIEVLLNQELGEPFRRDAMKKPVVVAGIDRKDMRPQKRA